MIHNTRALRYRPVVMFFDWKYPNWGELCPNNDCDGYGKAACEAVFGRGNVLSTGEATDKSVPELAGKVILTMLEKNSGDCIDKATVEGWFRSDPKLNFFRLDQYQGDWTFDIGVPPNPIVVDWTATPPWTITDSVGDDWFCITGNIGDIPCNVQGFITTCDFWKGQVVHEQGTYRFPYKTLSKAVMRADGITPTGASTFRPRRTGYGWTVLIRSGNYHETFTVAIPLTLKKDDRFDGNVVIGR